jgi:predicted RNase H-like nuclease (RuvC/YqgF family)
MSANSRCANCISKEEEVDLLKGELEELDSENQQLHDTISQLKLEESTNAQKLMSSQQIIARQAQEIQHLNETIKELNIQVKEQSKRKGMLNKNLVWCIICWTFASY